MATPLRPSRGYGSVALNLVNPGISLDAVSGAVSQLQPEHIHDESKYGSIHVLDG
jgi:hypothetical protein